MPTHKCAKFSDGTKILAALNLIRFPLKISTPPFPRVPHDSLLKKEAVVQDHFIWHLISYLGLLVSLQYKKLKCATYIYM